jgi:hypothetical protein
LGSEFQVSTYTIGYQSAPDLVVRSGGGFVIVWHSGFEDGAGSGVFARRFDGAGIAQAVEFQVNAWTQSYQAFGAVDADADGDFVVVWQSFLQDGSGYGVFGRRFNAAGVAQSLEFRVNTHTFSSQGFPAVAMNGAGDFVVAWRSYGQDDGGMGGVFARRFDAAGAALATELQDNTYTPGLQDLASVAIDGDGAFVVAWRSDQQDGDGYGVFARRFDASGAPLATEFQVSTYTRTAARTGSSRNASIPSAPRWPSSSR